ncbi:MAG: hypothetical protein JNL58_08835 [Planctomyces sp.]|nr:hypothetical protein [Planctomyces sp.]
MLSSQSFRWIAAALLMALYLTGCSSTKQTYNLRYNPESPASLSAEAKESVPRYTDVGIDRSVSFVRFSE